jgi:hypothetical protein
MKPSSSERGSVLITAAVAAAVIAVLVGGFLTFISDEYAMNLRSHAWTQALHMAEAGVELSFAEFNYWYYQGGNEFSSYRGWYSAGGGTYYRTVSSFYDEQGRDIGTVYCYVNGVGGSNPYVTGVATCPTSPRGPQVCRRVDVILRNSAMFPCAVVAKRTIDLNGNNVITDSYDSSDPAKSTNGLYDPAERQPNGDVASNDTVTNTVDVTVGNADIYGRVLVSPSGSVTMGPNGSIGPTLIEADRATTVAEAIADGYIRKDFQTDIPDVVLPPGAASWPALTGSATITSGDWKGTQIVNSRIISGNVRIYLTDSTSIHLTGNNSIRITPGSSLKIYAAGSVAAAGNGIVNTNGTPITCQLYGLPTCTSVKITGNGEWVGTAYAPQAAVELKGGGNSGYMSGAIVADTITFTGTTAFHYDEALGKYGPGSGYNMAGWRSFRFTNTVITAYTVANVANWISD